MFQLGHFFSEMDSVGSTEEHPFLDMFQLGHFFSEMDSTMERTLRKTVSRFQLGHFFSEMDSARLQSGNGIPITRLI